MLDYFMEPSLTLGVAGIAILMFLENAIPMIPSEVVMPAAGGSAREGNYSLFLAVVAGSVGSFLGTLLWYAIARQIGHETGTELALLYCLQENRF